MAGEQLLTSAVWRSNARNRVSVATASRRGCSVCRENAARTCTARRTVVSLTRAPIAAHTPRTPAWVVGNVPSNRSRHKWNQPCVKASGSASTARAISLSDDLNFKSSTGAVSVLKRSKTTAATGVSPLDPLHWSAMPLRCYAVAGTHQTLASVTDRRHPSQPEVASLLSGSTRRLASVGADAGEQCPQHLFATPGADAGEQCPQALQGDAALGPRTLLLECSRRLARVRAADR